ncbi:DUF1569 domain-containing protein [Mucilaginibacter sp.]|uniref:DUF1569 domain-containing protein n=1 Tax=Mucilaginibacter sp. TaxID=1882438 RepID=UPI00283BD677|nr:DUF1569 domain-containing protein [Mucilaginibacter sp.]MDR3697396.1 DUF1569 domain-containing protein [Mucilaginibacter sp.]
MKTVFDKTTRDELITRIDTLNEQSAAKWGKMNVYQMIKHCRLWEEMISGELKCRRSFPGRLFGKMALKGFLKDDDPPGRNTPTAPELKVKEGSGDVVAEKKKWIAMIEENAHFSNPYFIHPFFGKMTKEQVGCLAYKHIDHHLRQFGC